MGVGVFNFGIHLPREVFDIVKARIEQHVDYLDKPIYVIKTRHRTRNIYRRS